MVEYRQNSHAVWDVRYHVIWVTKYGYKVLRGEIAERARHLLRRICQARDVVIVQGAVSPDHVHMLVSVPPQLAPAKLVRYMKGKSSRMLQEEYLQLKKRYWGGKGQIVGNWKLTSGLAVTRQLPQVMARPALGQLEIRNYKVACCISLR